MKAFLLAGLFAMTFVAGAPAFAQEAAQILAQIRAENKQRYNSGGFINDPALTARFSASQKAAIARLRANGNLRRSFTITNNAMSSLVITVSLVQERSGQFAGLLVERNRYNNANEEASLRLYNIPILLNGMNLFGMNGVTLVSIKSQQLTPATGGRMTISYPTNYKSNTFGSASFDILKSTAGDMAFFTLERRGFSRAEVKVWTNIFAQNFGVEQVNFK